MGGVRGCRGVRLRVVAAHKSSAARAALDFSGTAQLQRTPTHNHPTTAAATARSKIPATSSICCAVMINGGKNLTTLP